jgi:sugar phosphate isomerase/epimerase
MNPTNVQKAKDNLCASFEKLIPLAEKNRILLSLENMEPRLDIGYVLSHPGEVAEVIERVESKWLKMTYDVAHAALAATYYAFDLLENFRIINKHVVKIHIHDNYCRPALYGKKDFEKGLGDLHLVPLIGKGRIPVEEILEEAGRDKLIIYELTPLEVEFRMSLGKLRDVMKSR